MKYTQLPLFNSPYYRYSIALENQTYELTFRWMTRRPGWVMDIREQDGTAVILGHRIVQQFPMLADIPLQSHGLNGYFALMPTDASTKTLNKNIDSMAASYQLFYIYK